MWVPSHIGIAGNTAADATAEVGLCQQVSKTKVPYSDLKPLPMLIKSCNSCGTPKTINKLHNFQPIIKPSILYKIPRLNRADYFRYHQPSMFTRNPSPFLIKPLNCPNYLTSIFYRSLHCWKSLQPELRQTKSLNIFKRKLGLQKLNLNNFLIGSVFNS